MTSAARQSLDQVEAALKDGSYRPGGWQRTLRLLPAEDVTADDLTRVSNQLHRRNGFPEAPFVAGLLLELLLAAGGIWLLAQPGLLLRLAGAVLFTLALQPTLKLMAGLLLGVRYSYCYLWYFEPRFKMAYGRYFLLPTWKKALFHGAGSIGTPLALAVAAVALRDVPLLSWASVAGSLVAVLMQVGAFVAAWMGVRRVGPFYLGTLTTPATLAQVLKGN